MPKLMLAAVLSLVGLNAQAGLVEIKCKPNADAKISQFIMVANLTIADDKTVSGSVQYATRASATAQTSDVQTISISGHQTTFAAGEIATHAVTTYHLVDEANDFVRMILNPDITGPQSSSLIVDQKYRYSSQCVQVVK